MMKPAMLLMAAPALLAATAAQAERLDIDHRLYAPLHAAMEQPHDGTVYYQASPSGAVFDRILIAGTSAQSDWTEALELVTVPRKGQARTPQDWLAAFRPQRESACPARVSVLGQDEISLTFALDAPDCPAGPPLSGLYRVIYGRKTIFLVGAKLKGAMSPAQREQWLALLGSARLAG